LCERERKVPRHEKKRKRQFRLVKKKERQEGAFMQIENLLSSQKGRVAAARK